MLRLLALYRKGGCLAAPCRDVCIFATLGAATELRPIFESLPPCTEIFGPVLSVLEVESKERAIEIENANPYGNAAWYAYSSVRVCMDYALFTLS